jgi:hypothetical protein
MAFLSRNGRAGRGEKRFAAATAGVFLALMLPYSLALKDLDPDFFRYRYLLLLAVIFTLIAYLLLSRRRLAFSLAILITAGLFTWSVNPVSTGMDAIFGKQVYQVATALEAEQPDSRWLAYGGNILADFLKSTGMEVANGNRYTPDLEFNRVLDPTGEFEDVYNRYGNVVFMEPAEGQGQGASYVLMQRGGAGHHRFRLFLQA